MQNWVASVLCWFTKAFWDSSPFEPRLKAARTERPSIFPDEGGGNPTTRRRTRSVREECACATPSSRRPAVQGGPFPKQALLGSCSPLLRKRTGTQARLGQRTSTVRIPIRRAEPSRGGRLNVTTVGSLLPVRAAKGRALRSLPFGWQPCFKASPPTTKGRLWPIYALPRL